MSTTINQHQQAALTTPINGTSPIDANQVTGNDNAIAQTYNAHDADPGIHVQSSVLASRPAAGIAGRIWFTSDTLQFYYDNGSAWQANTDTGYLPLTGGTLSGLLVIGTDPAGNATYLRAGDGGSMPSGITGGTGLTMLSTESGVVGAPTGMFLQTQTAASAGSVQGVEGYVTATHTTGTVALMIGTIGNVDVAGSGGTVTAARSVQGGGIVRAGATVTTFSSIVAAPPTNTGTIGTLVGVDVSAMTAGSTNFAIRTSTGVVSFGDALTVTGNYTSAAGKIGLGASPGTSGAINVDASSYASIGFNVINGTANGQLFNDNTQLLVWTTSNHPLVLGANNRGKWQIVNDASGTSSLKSSEVTARIVGGSTNGLSIRNSGNTRDNYAFSDAGTLFTFTDGTRAGRIANSAGSGEITSGSWFGSSQDTWIYSVAGGAGQLVGAAYFDGTQYRSAWQVANTASGFGAITLMKSGGSILSPVATIGFGTTPGTASAFNVDASAFSANVATFTNGTGVSVIQQAANGGMILGTTSNNVTILQSNASQRWTIQGGSAISELASSQVTARIIGGSSNGLAIRNSANTRDSLLFSTETSGSQITLNDGTGNSLINGGGGGSGEQYVNSIKVQGGNTYDGAGVWTRGSGTTGKVQLGYFDGTQFRSAVEVTNVASAFGTLSLMKSGGSVVIGTDITGFTNQRLRMSDGTAFPAGLAGNTANLGFVMSLGATASGASQIATQIAVTQSVANTGTVVGIQVASAATHTSGTVAQISGLSALALANGSGGTVTTAHALNTGITCAAGATIGTAQGVVIGTPSISGTVTTNIGLDVQAQTGGGTNFSIRTNTGPLSLGDIITTYNAVATAGIGVHATYAQARKINQAGASGTVATYTTPAADGSYIVCANVNVTAVVACNFTVTCTYTDESNAARTLVLSFSQISGTILSTITNVTGTGAYEGIPLYIRAKASTAITIQAAAGGTYTNVTYNIDGAITQVA